MGWLNLGFLSAYPIDIEFYARNRGLTNSGCFFGFETAIATVLPISGRSLFHGGFTITLKAEDRDEFTTKFQHYSVS